MREGRSQKDKWLFHPHLLLPHLGLCLELVNSRSSSFLLLKRPDLTEVTKEMAIKYSRELSACCVERFMGLRPQVGV